MRKRSLPPVGALTAVEDIKPNDVLYLVSTSKADSRLTLRISPEGVQIKGNGTSAYLEGVAVWNWNFWEEVNFTVDSLNLSQNGKAHKNQYNDAYLFRNYELAIKYDDYCMSAPDPRWITHADGHRRRTDITPFLAQAIGERCQPTFD